MVFNAIWFFFVYCPVARVMWNKYEDSFLFYGEKNIIDFAGGNVIHVTSGFAALAFGIRI
jgi:ammonia channel protein AmtB